MEDEEDVCDRAIVKTKNEKKKKKNLIGHMLTYVHPIGIDIRSVSNF